MADLTAVEVTCPLCGAPGHASLFARAATVRDVVAKRLREADPAWKPARGACPACVFAATRDVLTGSDRAELFAVDNVPRVAGAFPALPVGVRVGAHSGPRGRGITLAMLDAGFHHHDHLTKPRNRIRRLVHAAGRREPGRSVPELVGHDGLDEAHRWHGSMTSGVAAGNGLLSDGLYPGLASESDLVLVRVRGAGGRIGDSQIAAGLRWVLTHHETYAIRVVSLSVGGDRPILTLRSPVNRLVRRLVRRGVVVVAAAGNRPGAAMVPPATAPEALTVGGLDDRNQLDPRNWRPWPSTHGVTVDGITKPDLLAPSVWVPAPILPQTAVAREAELLVRLAEPATREKALARLPKKYARWRDASTGALLRGIALRARRLKLVDARHQHVDGTSFAAPIVASCVAQVLEVSPGLDPLDVRVVMLRTAASIDGLPESVQGAGVLRAGAAVAYARRLNVWRTAWPSPRRLPEGFVFLHHAPNARSVRVVGEWNGWGRLEQRLVPVVPGVFRGRLPRPPRGEYAYAFLVDGQELVPDPENPRAIPDGCGGQVSVLRV